MKIVSKVSAFVVSAVLCVSLIGCEKSENASSETTQAQEPVVISKTQTDFTDEQSPVFRYSALDSMQYVNMIAGFDFPSKSEIIWNYSTPTSFAQSAQQAEYKPFCTVCDVSVALSEKESLISNLRAFMHEAPINEMTSWQAVAECKGGILTDETERYDFYYKYNACDDSSENVTCVCEAAVFILEDRIAVVISDGVQDVENILYYEAADILSDYYFNSLTRGRVFEILRKPQLETIADIQILLNVDLPESAQLGVNKTYENNDPSAENNTSEFKPYGYFAEFTVAADDTKDLLTALKNQSTRALTGHTVVTDQYASDFEAEYLQNISDEDELLYFEREYDANESPAGRCPVLQYIYVFKGTEHTTVLMLDPALNLPE